MVKYRKFVAISIIVLSFAWLVIFFGIPAYQSVQLNCFVTEEVQEEESAGTFNAETGEIALAVPSKNVLKQELIHSVQKDRNMLYGCDFPYLNYISEFNSYIGASIPDEIYLSIYSPDHKLTKLLYE